MRVKWQELDQERDVKNGTVNLLIDTVNQLMIIITAVIPIHRMVEFGVTQRTRM
jgi:hypothetical protein